MVVSKSIFRASKSTDVMAWLLCFTLLLSTKWVFDSYETLQSGSEEVQESAACCAWSLVEHHTVTLHHGPVGPIMSHYGASLAAGVKQSLRHSAEPIYMQKWYNRIRYLLKSAEIAKEPLQKWVYACMHEHSVGAERQVGNQQVISTDSVPFPS